MIAVLVMGGLLVALFVAEPGYSSPAPSCLTLNDAIRAVGRQRDVTRYAVTGKRAVLQFRLGDTFGGTAPHRSYLCEIRPVG